MKKVLEISKHFVADEKAAEVTELGIVAALIVALSVVLIGSIGGKVQTAFTTLDGAMP